jgi:hypothetical protein
VTDELFTTAQLRGKPCPACGKKGLFVAWHPHAFGWKDPTRAKCRFCHKSFRKKPVPSVEAGEGDR